MNTLELLNLAPIQFDRVDWARRGHPNYKEGGTGVISVEYSGNITNVAALIDDWLKTYPEGSVVTDVQVVHRRGKKVVYAQVMSP